MSITEYGPILAILVALATAAMALILSAKERWSRKRANRRQVHERVGVNTRRHREAIFVSEARTQITTRTIQVASLVATVSVAALFASVVWLDDGPQASLPDASLCVTEPRACTLQAEANEITEGADTEAELRRRIEKISTNPPWGQGPWSFYVIGTGGLGLKVRSSAYPDANQIGSTHEGSILWADCIEDSGYTAGLGTSRWLRIRWPDSSPSAQFGSSSPVDKGIGYVHADYTLPFAHNGSIPYCR